MTIRSPADQPRVGHRKRDDNRYQLVYVNRRADRSSREHGRNEGSPIRLRNHARWAQTCAFLLMGTIVIIGALLFLPVAALGPAAEFFGPIPFGG